MTALRGRGGGGFRCARQPAAAGRRWPADVVGWCDDAWRGRVCWSGRTGRRRLGVGYGVALLVSAAAELAVYLWPLLVSPGIFHDRFESAGRVRCTLCGLWCSACSAWPHWCAVACRRWCCASWCRVLLSQRPRAASGSYSTIRTLHPEHAPSASSAHDGRCVGRARDRPRRRGTRPACVGEHAQDGDLPARSGGGRLRRFACAAALVVALLLNRFALVFSGRVDQRSGGLFFGFPVAGMREARRRRHPRTRGHRACGRRRWCAARRHAGARPSRVAAPVELCVRGTPRRQQRVAGRSSPILPFLAHVLAAHRTSPAVLPRSSAGSASNASPPAPVPRMPRCSPADNERGTRAGNNPHETERPNTSHPWRDLEAGRQTVGSTVTGTPDPRGIPVSGSTSSCALTERAGARPRAFAVAHRHRAAANSRVDTGHRSDASVRTGHTHLVTVDDAGVRSVAGVEQQEWFSVALAGIVDRVVRRRPAARRGARTRRFVPSSDVSSTARSASSASSASGAMSAAPPSSSSPRTQASFGLNGNAVRACGARCRRTESGCGRRAAANTPSSSSAVVSTPKRWLPVMRRVSSAKIHHAERRPATHGV